MIGAFTRDQIKLYDWFINRVNYSPRIEDAVKTFKHLSKLPENTYGKSLWIKYTEMTPNEIDMLKTRVIANWQKDGWKK